MHGGLVDGSPSPNTVPPGWYPDPWQIAPYRWWDGASWTGEASPPNDGVDQGVALGDRAEFVGGMNVPSNLGGRLNATVPLVLLTVGEDTVRMHPRSLLKAMFTDFEVPLAEVTAAFPLRGTIMTSGMGFELSDGELAYFWTYGDKDRILAVLQRRGVRIDPLPRRATRSLSGQFGMLWRWERSSSTAARVPGYSRTMTALMPLFMIFGVVVIATFALSGQPVLWLGAVLGTFGLVRTFMIWRGHRGK